MNRPLIVPIVVFFFLITCCKTPTSPVFEINKRVVYNADCDFVLYATNETDFFSPNLLYSPFGSHKTRKTLSLPSGNNYYVRDASCDCKFVLLLTEKLNENKYDIYLYNLDTDSSHNITDGIQSTFTDPIFINRDTLLFLKDGELHAYGISSKDWKYYPSDNKFLYLFKGDQQRVLLQDAGSSIWMCDLEQRRFSKIWEAASLFSSTRKVMMHEGQLFFLSDHENGFNSIYKINLETLQTTKISFGRYDYFLVNNSLFISDTLTYIKNDGVHFVSNIEKLPKDGVLYDYVVMGDSILMLYADDKKPASLYLLSDTGTVNMLDQFDQPIDYTILVENKESAVDNLIFLPKENIKHWVVWLHGGPHEQVSKRFNPYLYHLLLNNIGIIVLNYPGSTGAGNDFELRHVPKEKHMDIQLKAVKTDLVKILQKYNIDSFSLIGVSYGSTLAHRLAIDREVNVKKLIDFSGIHTGRDILDSSIETLYVMGESDFMLSNKQRIALLNDHKKIGARAVILKSDGHNISRKKNMALAINNLISFLKE